MQEAEKAAEGSDEGSEPVAEPVAEPASEPAVEPTEETLGELEPPTAWTAEQQDVFRNMPENAQEWILDIYESAINPLQEQLDSLAHWQQVQQQWNP